MTFLKDGLLYFVKKKYIFLIAFCNETIFFFKTRKQLKPELNRNSPNLQHERKLLSTLDDNPHKCGN